MTATFSASKAPMAYDQNAYNVPMGQLNSAIGYSMNIDIKEGYPNQYIGGGVYAVLFAVGAVDGTVGDESAQPKVVETPKKK